MTFVPLTPKRSDNFPLTSLQNYKIMNNLLTILGPTACGKTTFAAQLAYDMDGEIISADSRQVYRGMDIGTGKDLADYHVKDKDIPYHLIDIAEAGTRYNVYEWQNGFLDAYTDIVGRGKTPILCGGTGMYIESVIKGYEFDGRKFPPFQSLIIGLDISRNLRREKISRRLRARLEEGMIDEVKGLIDRGSSTSTSRSICWAIINMRRWCPCWKSPSINLPSVR